MSQSDEEKAKRGIFVLIEARETRAFHHFIPWNLSFSLSSFSHFSSSFLILSSSSKRHLFRLESEYFSSLI